MTRIALVVLDTLRKDAFDDHFDWLPGHRFENAWSPSHWTVPVHGSLFTGKYPTEHGSLANSKPLTCSDSTLSETLVSEGFSTRGFSANPFVTPAFNFDRGFQTFDGSFDNLPMFDKILDWRAFHEEYGDEGIRRFGRALLKCFQKDVDTARSLKVGLQIKLREARDRQDKDSGITEAIEWLKSQRLNEDEFVFFNLMEAHAPYDMIPQEYVSGSAPSELGLQHHFEPLDESQTAEAYNAAVSYLSDAYRKLFADLTRRMDFVITLGDHGELLGEHAYYGHEYGLFPELTHVPLAVSGEGLENTERDSVVSLLDVYPTVLKLAGIHSNRRGESLLEEKRGSRTYLTEGHGLPQDRVQKLSKMGHNVERYDSVFRGIVTTDGYEYESIDGWELCGAHTSNKFKDELDDLVERLEESSETSDRPDISQAALERLKANGYA
ncbi:sulfatase-like hydrolase/transferase [Natrinema sp. DC36]|uniref:sulfatase-like hydrolase/transferase n=1 Tax=Natrinema sp. DC36 TaxID=2878680 RepID=UPI001CEFCF76|nr:sulfatase-like hydrolase/transferase [Natrinema sp. DC36]